MNEIKTKLIVVNESNSLKNEKSSLIKVKETLKYIFNILKLMINENRNKTLIWIMITLLLGFFPTLNVWLSKLSIDTINKISIDNSYYIKALYILGVSAFVSFINVIMVGINGIIYSKINNGVSFNIQKQLYIKLTEINLERFEDNLFHRKVALAQEAINRNGLNIINNFFKIIQQILVVGGIIYILFEVHWSLPIVLLISTIPGMIAIFIGKSRMYKYKWGNSELVRKVNYTAALFFNKQSLKEIKLFRLGSYLTQKWTMLYDSNFTKTMEVSINQEKAKWIGVSIIQITNILISLFLISKVSDHKITLGVFVASTAAITTVQASFGSIWENVGGIFEIILPTKQLLDILNYDEDVSKTTKNSKIINEIKTIDIKNISFKYPGADRFSIKNINLSIKKGEKIAIVGDNGSGKSTLINIILGLFQEYEGKMKINGIDISEVDLDSYNKCVSAILQDFTKYMFSLKENVVFGDINKYEENKLIIDTLVKVGLNSKLSSLSLGIDTLLSKEYGNGTELSGGEWQKVAIARAIIKDSDFIVLDEPTSALDPLSELEIFEFFNNLSEGKTSIMISHRLGITRYADRIIVLQNGAIVEEGSHDELIAYGGVYKKMYESQANWYI